ncbi:MAG: hypothetical protein ACXWT0_00455 [Methylobacter sp.]
MADKILKSLGLSKRTFIAENITPAQQITQADSWMYGADATSVSTLLGTGKKAARNRSLVYQQWSLMESDGICSSALKLLTTTALGGDKTDGNMVFIEKNPDFQGDKRAEKMVDEISGDLTGTFNKVAYPVAYTGAAFGDSYARIYANNRGVIDLHIDEMIRPPLVQPFERGGRTVGYAIYIGERNFERLDVSQLARMKMPRTQWVPQWGVVEKALRIAITEDDIDKLPIMPSMAGGSLLYNAEESYGNLTASLMGLVGQRWMDSIDEQMVSVNMESMTKEQQDRFLSSIVKMLKKSKDIAENAAKEGRPVLERIRHIIPVFNEKQVTQIASPNGGQSGRSSSLTIDDVMLHAKLLSASIGVDLSMIGFSEILSGGLGDGGFFRMSAQAAENSRSIRTAQADFYNDVIDIHTMRRYGVVFPKNNRPWKVNFYGSISALEAEEQRTKADKMNAGLLLVGAIQQFKEAGATKEMMAAFLADEMCLSETQAKLYAAIVDQKSEEENGGGFPGGGFPSGEQ